jgi:hypothetical protein
MSRFNTAQLAIYAVLSLPVIYILLRHGRPGLIGWFYLLAFCSLRIAGGAMSLSLDKRIGHQAQPLRPSRVSAYLHC